MVLSWRRREVFVLEYQDALSPEGWSVLMCNRAKVTLTEHLVNLPKATKYRIVTYAPKEEK